MLHFFTSKSNSNLMSPLPLADRKSPLRHFQATIYSTHQHKNTGAFVIRLGQASSLVLFLGHWIFQCPTQVAHPMVGDLHYLQDPPPLESALSLKASVPSQVAAPPVGVSAFQKPPWLNLSPLACSPSLSAPAPGHRSMQQKLLSAPRERGTWKLFSTQNPLAALNQ